MKSSREEHRRKVETEKQAAMSAQRSTYQRKQNTVFTLLDMPETKVAYVYHAINLSMIFVSMVISVLSTVQYFSKNKFFTNFIMYIEVALSFFILFDGVLRIDELTNLTNS